MVLGGCWNPSVYSKIFTHMFMNEKLQVSLVKCATQCAGADSLILCLCVSLILLELWSCSLTP